MSKATGRIMPRLEALTEEGERWKTKCDSQQEAISVTTKEEAKANTKIQALEDERKQLFQKCSFQQQAMVESHNSTLVLQMTKTALAQQWDMDFLQEIVRDSNQSNAKRQNEFATLTACVQELEGSLEDSQTFSQSQANTTTPFEPENASLTAQVQEQIVGTNETAA